VPEEIPSPSEWLAAPPIPSPTAWLSAAQPPKLPGIAEVPLPAGLSDRLPTPQQAVDATTQRATQVVQIVEEEAGRVRPAQQGFVTPLKAAQFPKDAPHQDVNPFTQPILDPEAVDRELSNFLVGPFAIHRGIIKGLASAATPANAGIAVATGGLGALRGVLPKLGQAGVDAVNAGLSAYFGTEAGKALIKTAPEAYKAFQAGDTDKAMELGGESAVNAAFAGLAGYHAARTGVAAARTGAEGVADAVRPFQAGGKYGAGIPTKAEVVTPEARPAGVAQLPAGQEPIEATFTVEPAAVPSPTEWLAQSEAKQLASGPGIGRARPNPYPVSGSQGEPVEMSGRGQPAIAEGRPPRQIGAGEPVQSSVHDVPTPDVVDHFRQAAKMVPAPEIPSESVTPPASDVPTPGVAEPRFAKFEEAKRLKNSIQEGDTLLRAGVDAQGRKLKPEYLNSVAQLVERQRSRLAEIAAPEPGTVATVPTKSLRVDPTRFQFKSDVGQGGVGEEFRGVTKFDPEKSGILSVWHDPADGQTYVVNGHHRFELADRLNAPELTVRYLDAKDAKEARTKGALINIAEGRGDSLDAAKVFRDSGLDELGLQREGISLRGEKAREGLALANLDPHLFSKVVSGEIPKARGAVIGEGVKSPEDQRSLVDLLDAREKNGKRLTNDQVAEMIRLTNQAPKTTETQENLFGSEEMTRSLIPEKAEVSEYVQRRMVQEKRLFQAVGSDTAAARLGSAGNVIKAGENAQVAERTGQAHVLYQKLSTVTGPVNDALDVAASAIAKGDNSSGVKEAAYEHIKAALLDQAAGLTRTSPPPAQGPEGDARGGAGAPGAGQRDRAAPIRKVGTLPSELAGAASRYAIGPHQFQVAFESDIDKAAYIAAQKTRSKRDADYLRFAMDATGLSESHVRAEGLRIRSSLGTAAREAINSGDVTEPLRVERRIPLRRREGERGSFSNKPSDSPDENLSIFGREADQRDAAESDRAKLEGDRLTAQMRAPLTRGEQLKKLKRAPKAQQGDFFEEAPESPRQGGLFGGSEEGAIHVPLDNLEKYAREKLKMDEPRLKVSGVAGTLGRAGKFGMGAVKDKYLRNLSQLEEVSPKAHSAAVRAASSGQQAAALINAAVPRIEKALGPDFSWERMRMVLTESVLRGKQERWLNWAGQVRSAPPSRLKAMFEHGLKGVLDSIEGYSFLPMNVADTAIALMNDADTGQIRAFGSLRDFLGGVFQTSADEVAHVMSNEDFEADRHNPDYLRGKAVYKNLIEEALAESHASNEGIFSTALGPESTYIPLIPLSRADALRGTLGQTRPYTRPANFSNEFATGLGEYDLSMKAFRDRVTRSFKGNDKAAFIKTLEEEGLLQRFEGNRRRPDTMMVQGVETKAVQIETRGGRETIKGGRNEYLPAEEAITPVWLKKEVEPILKQEDLSEPGLVKRAFNLTNRVALSGPVELVMHSHSLVSSIQVGTPFVGSGVVKAASFVPLAKKVAVLIEIARADPGSARAAEELQEMARAGYLPSRYGSETFSRAEAERSGAEVTRIGFGPALYSRTGVDVRARLVMYRTMKRAFPDATPVEQHKFMSMLPQYTAALQSTVERAVKRTGVAPFYTAGSTGLRNGVMAWTGLAPMPAGHPGLRIARLLNGGAIGTVALWVLIHKLYSGQFPWEDPKSKFMQFRVKPEARQSWLGLKYWGTGPEDGYVNFAFFNPSVKRGANALGIAGAYDTWRAGGDAGQIREAAVTGGVNAVAQPLLGPGARSAFALATGSETYLTGLRDRDARPKPTFLAASKDESAAPHFGAALRQMNSLYSNIGAAVGFGTVEPEYAVKGDHWLRMVTDLVVPQLVGQAANAKGRADFLAAQRSAEEKRAAKRAAGR
jgi:hypothetical protein